MKEGFVGNPGLMKKINLSMVLDLIRTQGPLSRADIARTLKLSPPTVSSLVKSLIEDKLVVEIGRAPSTTGKRPTLLRYNASAGFGVGVYVDGIRMILGVTDLMGRILKKIEIQQKGALLSAQDIVDAVRKAIKAAGEEVPLVRESELRGIGVAVAGVTDPSTGTVLSARYLGGLVGVPLRSIITEEFHVTVYVDNDVYMGALGESLYGRGRSVENMLFVTIGEGIGVGIIIDNQVYRGAHHASGEMGDMIIDRGVLNGNGTRGGYFERLAGWDSLVEKARSMLLGNESKPMRNESKGVLRDLVQGDPSKLTADVVHRAAAAGDAFALDIVHECARNLAIGIANVISILDPELVVLAGDIISVADLYLDEIRGTLECLLPRQPQIELSELGRDAELLGAVGVALNRVHPSYVVKSGDIVA